MDTTYITERIAEALEELFKMGWQCPIHAVTVAANGSVDLQQRVDKSG